VSSAPDLTSRILRHDRTLVASGIALLALVSWWFVAAGGGMDRGSSMAMPAPPFAALVVMWWVMMAAMMLPSAAPTILLYARVRGRRGSSAELAQPWVFLLGYLGVWLLFSLAAAGVQRLVAGPTMRLDSPGLESAVLIAAGIYQLSPVKSACLRQCQSPAAFLSRHWRPGAAGAVRLGVIHGAYCVGCCWMLMALLFVGGIMNVAWIVVLTLIVALEKLVHRGEWIGRAAGAALIVWGAIRIAAL
jgi:predicted metal-binding membrane protein